MPVRKNPVIFSVFIIFLYFFLEILIFSVLDRFKILEIFQDEYLTEIVEFIVGLSVVLFVVHHFRFGFIYKKGDFNRSFQNVAVLLAFYFSIFIYEIFVRIQNNSNFKPRLGILAGFLDLFLTGFSEETIFRGIIANSIAKKYAKNKKGICFSVVVSGFLFGASHIINLLSGVSLSANLLQVLIASVIGMFLTAAYLSGQNIWPLIILHCVIDGGSLADYFFVKNFKYMDLLNESLNTSDLIYYIITLGIYALLTLFLLRKKKQNEIIKNFML